ncbi:ABC transporter substrate-binding protein [Natronobacterium texcoconense]|uniref:Amino acid/amide ABC transporter substrate-binding protein, HAAT family n=1 Tax=Natronobacterium texcoconense TaxID=1095778 RepID=A0A1H1BTW4_NATTX|nr:ABC transporter substrate-binding protein [Natronobacterium texcoconense]SDQ55190.1 amino acid/amide ABC transporter substrate-binding protein, HAAT family [Natronobacterium texcoconense]
MDNDSNTHGAESTDGRTGVDRRRFLAAGTGAVATSVAGCLDLSGEAGAGGEVTIGVLAPLGQDQGVGAENAAEMAVDEINDDGGIDGADVELVVVDTLSDPGETQDETERLIEVENADLLVGTFSSEATQGALETIGEYGIPFIITGSAAPSLVTDFVADDYEQYKSVFRSGPINSNLQAEAMGDYAEYLEERHGWEEFAFLADNAAWTEPFAENLPDILEDRGYEVVHEDRLQPGLDDWSSVIGDLQNAAPDAVFRFFAHNIATELLGAWHQQELDFGIEGIHVASMTPDFFEVMEGAASFETTSQSGAAGATAITEHTQDFVERYQEEYDEPALPMYMGFNTYDAIHVYHEAVERAGTTNWESDLDDIVDAMLETEYTGTAGTVEFYGPDSDYPHDLQETRDEDDVISNFPVTQWTPEGEIECVYPEAHRTADHQAPPWMG